MLNGSSRKDPAVGLPRYFAEHQIILAGSYFAAAQSLGLIDVIKSSKGKGNENTKNRIVDYESRGKSSQQGPRAKGRGNAFRCFYFYNRII